jgi:hypothetical protein
MFDLLVIEKLVPSSIVLLKTRVPGMLTVTGTTAKKKDYEKKIKSAEKRKEMKRT